MLGEGTEQRCGHWVTTPEHTWDSTPQPPSSSLRATGLSSGQWDVVAPTPGLPACPLLLSA